MLFTSGSSLRKRKRLETTGTQDADVIIKNSEEEAATRRALFRKKLKYKFSLMICVWGLTVAYLTFTTGKVNSSPSAAPRSSDVVLAEESVPPYYYSYDTGRLLQQKSPGVLLASGPNGSAWDDEYSNLVPGFNCTLPAIQDFPTDLFTQAERRSGAVIFHFLVSIYVFYALALVCDDYFVPSIESISESFHVPSDVAGATFMAIATSAPELFTNVIGTFITESDIGIGTIVGSAVFNILAICACCGLAAHEALELDWWPLTRDCFFYTMSVIILILVLANGKIFWYEALCLLLFYVTYILVMYYNSKCKHIIERLAYKIAGRTEDYNLLQQRRRSLLGSRKHSLVSSKNFSSAGEKAAEKTPLIGENDKSIGPNKRPVYYSEDVEYNNEDYNGNDEDLELSAEIKDEILISKALHHAEIHAEEEKREWGLLSLPFGQGPVVWLEWILGWPARFFLSVTIPDCREHRFRKWYPITFLMCIVWIAGLSYIVSWMMTVIGHTLQVPDSVMGLTFLAAGTSVPEAVSSIIVSRQGLGSMGISNSIGSNTFDILICLGLPWLIKGIMLNSSSSSENYVQINSGGLEYSTILLITSVVLLYSTLACNRFVLTKRVAIVALCMYLGFLIISSLFELNIFFIVNQPTCPIDL